MSLSDNFYRYEFSCPCCGQDTIDAELIKLLEMVRAHFGGKPVKITSGNRCEIYNASIPGASKNSQHLYGRAADFKIEGVEPKEIAEYLDTLIPNHGGIKWYSTWTHLDTRTDKWRGNDSSN